MPSFDKDDYRAMDLISNGVDSNVSDQIKTKLGINDDDIKAWKLSKTIQDKNISEDLQTSVIEKVRMNKDANRIKAGLYHFAQGASYGFSDTLMAAAKATYDKIVDGKDYNSAFNKRQKLEEQELKILSEKYPLESITNELVGAYFAPFPGSGEYATIRNASKIGKLAIEAGLYSAGKSEAPAFSKQYIQDVSLGTTFGVAMGKGVEKGTEWLVELAKKGEKPIKKATLVISNLLFDLPKNYAEKLLNPKTAQKILNPKTADEIVDSVVELTDKMAEQSKALSIKATEKLNKEKNITVEDVLGGIAEIKSMNKTFRSSMPEAESAKKTVEFIAKDLTARGGKEGFLSEVDLKRFIQDLDNEIPWNTNEWKLKDEIMAEVRGFIDHQILKKNNPEYSKQMIGVDELVRNMKEISRSFSLKRNGYNVVPTDATYSKTRSFFDVAGNSKKPISEEALKKGQSLIPETPNILEDIELAQIANRTNTGLQNGAKNVAAFGALGTFLDIPIAGIVMGMIKDKYGRSVGKKVLPKISEAVSKMDDATLKYFQNTDPRKAATIGQLLGRIKGVDQGISTSEKRRFLIPEN